MPKADVRPPLYYPPALSGQKKYRRALRGLAPLPNTPPKDSAFDGPQPTERPRAHVPNTSVHFLARMRAKGKHVLSIRGRVRALDGTDYFALSDGTLRRRRIVAARPAQTDKAAPVPKPTAWQRLVRALAPQHTRGGASGTLGSPLVRP